MKNWLRAIAMSLALCGAAHAQGLVTSPTLSIPVTPTVTASSTYSAGNEVGGLMTFVGASAPPTFAGVLESVSITSKSAQTGELDLYLCTTLPVTTFTDKTGPSINAADVTKCSIGPIKLTVTGSGLGTHTVYNSSALGIVFQTPDQTKTPTATNSLYGILITPAQPSAQFGSTSDLTVTLGILQ